MMASQIRPFTAKPTIDRTSQITRSAIISPIPASYSPVNPTRSTRAAAAAPLVTRDRSLWPFAILLGDLVARTHNAQVFLTGVILMPLGWLLFGPLGVRLANPEYRNDEDLYTVLTLFGGFLLLLGTALVLAGIFRALRQVDSLPAADRKTSQAADPEAPGTNSEFTPGTRQ